jgi:hypothetical protein
MPKLCWSATILALVLAQPLCAAEYDWGRVDAILGRAPSRAGDIVRYGFPRGDLHVTVDGVTIKPPLALGGWAAFEAHGDKTVVMGDLVLAESEVNPVVSRLLAGGVEATALHNHLLRASPPVVYLHFLARGDAVAFAQTLRAALALTGAPLDASSPASPAAAPLDLDAAALDATIGTKGKANGGVYQFAVPRAAPIMEGGVPLSAAMGGANVINFQPTGGGKAAITGDFIALAGEVGPLLRVLRSQGVEVTAIHSHMLDEEPRAIFVHFWAHDDAKSLAKAMRSALRQVQAAPR